MNTDPVYTDTTGITWYNPLPEVNVPLLRKVYEKVLEESAKPNPPSTPFGLLVKDAENRVLNDGSFSMWDQRNWIVEHTCGTGGCFAGWTALLAGAETSGMNVMINGQVHWISTWAQKELGITGGEADDLFAGANSVDDIRSKVELLMTRAGDRL